MSPLTKSFFTQSEITNDRILLMGNQDLTELVQRSLSGRLKTTLNASSGIKNVILISEPSNDISYFESRLRELGCTCITLVLIDTDEDFYFEDRTDNLLITISKKYTDFYADIIEACAISEFKALRENPPKCPDLSTPRSVLPPLYGKTGLTDFPSKGLDEEICFENSRFALFPLSIAKDIIRIDPKLWCKGGNYFGNKAYEYWLKADKAIKAGKPIPKDSKRWIKKRERYIARHANDYRPAGIIAMIKWAGFVNGPNGNGAEDGSTLEYMLTQIGISDV